MSVSSTIEPIAEISPTARDVAPILIAACGNELAGDDGFGPQALASLTRQMPEETQAIDLSMDPSQLLELLPGRRAVILLDAISTGADGTPDLLDIDGASPEHLPLLRQREHSSHGMGLAQWLLLASALHLLPPRVRLIGLAVRQTNVGEPVSDRVRKAADRAAERCREWCGMFSLSAGVVGSRQNRVAVPGCGVGIHL